MSRGLVRKVPKTYQVLPPTQKSHTSVFFNLQYIDSGKIYETFDIKKGNFAESIFPDFDFA